MDGYEMDAIEGVNDVAIANDDATNHLRGRGCLAT
jgi:hypothetical protein